jgi:hypothetical protein
MSARAFRARAISQVGMTTPGAEDDYKPLDHTRHITDTLKVF